MWHVAAAEGSTGVLNTPTLASLLGAAILALTAVFYSMLRGKLRAEAALREVREDRDARVREAREDREARLAEASRQIERLQNAASGRGSTGWKRQHLGRSSATRRTSAAHPSARSSRVSRSRWTSPTSCPASTTPARWASSCPAGSAPSTTASSSPTRSTRRCSANASKRQV